MPWYLYHVLGYIAVGIRPPCTVKIEQKRGPICFCYLNKQKRIAAYPSLECGPKLAVHVDVPSTCVKLCQGNAVVAAIGKGSPMCQVLYL